MNNKKVFRMHPIEIKGDVAGNDDSVYRATGVVEPEQGKRIADQKKRKKSVIEIQKEDLKARYGRTWRLMESLLREEEKIFFKPGKMELNDGSSVTLSKNDVAALNKFFAEIKVSTRKDSMKSLMKNKKSFEEILQFAEAI